MGKGTNLLNIKCILGDLSDETQIMDYIVYDDATSNKSSNYDLTNISLSFDNDHYVSVSSTTSSGNNNYMGFIEPKNMEALPNFSIECDIKCVSETGQNGLIDIDNIVTVSGNQKAVELISAFNSNQKGIVFRPWDGSNRVNTALSKNIWYTFKLQIIGTSVTGVISQNGVNVYSKTATYANASELQHICIYQADVASTIHWKNLKIQKL